MKKLLFKICLFLPIIFFMAIVNWVVDPAKIFSGGKHENQMAAAMLEGKNIIAPGNFDARLLSKIYLQASTPDIIVMGSSRSMQIHQDIFNSQSFFNASVNDNRLHDMIALYEVCKERDKLPKKIIIGIDPWIFNSSIYQGTRFALQSHLERGMKRMMDTKATMPLQNIRLSLDRLLPLVSPAYFQSSCQSVINPNGEKGLTFTLTPSKKLRLTTSKFSESSMEMLDGSRKRPRKPIDLKKLSLRIESGNKSGLIYGFRGNNHSIDPALKNMFEQYIAMIKGDKIEIIIFLPPYHKIRYDFFASTEKFSVIPKIEDYLRAFCKTNKIMLIGSYNPATYKLDEFSSYDGFHPTTKATELIFKNHGYSTE